MRVLLINDLRLNGLQFHEQLGVEQSLQQLVQESLRRTLKTYYQINITIIEIRLLRVILWDPKAFVKDVKGYFIGSIKVCTDPSTPNL